MKLILVDRSPIRPIFLPDRRRLLAIRKTTSLSEIDELPLLLTTGVKKSLPKPPREARLRIR